MNPKLSRILIRISAGTLPFLLLVVIWTAGCGWFRLLPLASAGMSLIFYGSPLLFPAAAAGTILSCRRSVPVRQRPLLIMLGTLGTVLTGLVLVFWWGVLFGHWVTFD